MKNYKTCKKCGVISSRFIIYCRDCYKCFTCKTTKGLNSYTEGVYCDLCYKKKKEVKVKQEVKIEKIPSVECFKCKSGNVQFVGYGVKSGYFCQSCMIYSRLYDNDAYRVVDVIRPNENNLFEGDMRFDRPLLDRTLKQKIRRKE